MYTLSIMFPVITNQYSVGCEKHNYDLNSAKYKLKQGKWKIQKSVILYWKKIMTGTFAHNSWCKKTLAVLVNMYRLKVLNLSSWDAQCF